MLMPGQAVMPMRIWFRRPKLAAVIGMSLIAWPSLAQDPYRLRGSIVEVDLPKVEVEIHDGTSLDLTLGEPTRLFVVTSVAAPPDRHVALGVHIFAEELRGLGGGQASKSIHNESR